MKRETIHHGYTHNGLYGGSMTSAAYQILLSVVDGPSHGYAIMREVETRTLGSVMLGPATLYRSLERLLASGLIAEHPGESGTDRRRRYSITRAGKAELRAEAERLLELGAQAVRKGILPT